MASSYDPRVARTIAALAVQYGLDPQAVLAVGAGEGGIVADPAIGDGGTSFGAFQLHWGGAMPKKYWGNAAASEAFAKSPAGLKYAVSQMARVAKGLKGREAIHALVHKFERPREDLRAGAIEKAAGRYGSFQLGKGATMRPSGGAAPMAPSGAAAGLPAQADELALALLGRASARARGEQAPSLLPTLVQLSQQREALGAATEAFGPTPTRGPLVPRAKGGPVRGSIAELFHDPIGGIDNGTQIGPVGGHDKHVHFATENPRVMAAVAARAKALGLSIREDGRHDKVDPVHTDGSFHYQKFGGKHGDQRKAADISGDPKAMAALYRWIEKNYR